MASAIPSTSAHPITDQGLSVVYDPPGQAIADIVFVHGLQGHPWKTWAAKKPSNAWPTESPHGINEQHSVCGPEKPNDATSKSKKRRLKEFLVSLPRQKSRGPNAIASGSSTGHQILDANLPQSAESQMWFWPQHSVPVACPDARVLTWGYDTVVTRPGHGPACKASIMSHGKDLLFSLERFRRDTDAGRRPLIFVAHSLGGIVVKEMLSCSARIEEARNVLESTAAIIFLGTPHRGSVSLARLGNKGRSIISALGFDTASDALDALGLRSTDLERCQESFSALWRLHGFRVKTFQESLGISGINIGPLNDQVVEGFSSLLGDDREKAETLHANHKDMARFFGPDDLNQARVVGEIREIYSQLAQDKPQSAQRENIVAALTIQRGELLDALYFDGIEQRPGITTPTSLPRYLQVAFYRRGLRAVAGRWAGR
ncbi:hypothetical protein RB597_005022 [Gaeumannomyces tritici]